MLIWILAVLLLGGFGAMGYGKGAIRMAFPLLGLVLAIFLAMPLSPLVKPLVPMMKLTNPVWSWLLPPVIVYLIFAIVFVPIGFGVHRKIALHFKYKKDELQQGQFLRLNHRLGAGLGVLVGSIYLILVGLVIYVFGYFTVQVASADTDNAFIRYFNQARADLHSSGLDKTVAYFDPTPEPYYRAVDVLGLIYTNPAIYNRLSNYPGLISMSERSEFQDLGKDTQFQEMLQTRQSLVTILDNPKTQGILNNQEIMGQLEQLDLKDLRGYLETGKSAKYDDEKILGRWRVDLQSVITQARKQNPMFSTNAVALKMLKRFAVTVLNGVTLIATPDNKIIVKSQPGLPPPELAAAIAPPPAAAAPAPAPAPIAAPGTMTPVRPQSSAANPRYGLGSPTTLAQGVRQRLGQNQPPRARGPALVAPQVAVAAAAPPRAAAPAVMPKIPADLKLSGQGTWKYDGDKYQLSIQTEGGKEVSLEGGIDNDRMVMANEDGPSLVFVRTY